MSNKNLFYKYEITIKRDDQFYMEALILKKTVDTVNNFSELYNSQRKRKKGSSEDIEQDLHRAMLIFACAGLDVLAKSLIRTKLPYLLSNSMIANEAFTESIRRGIERKDSKELIKILSLSLTNVEPRKVLLNEYINNLIGDSLQSLNKIKEVIKSLGLEFGKIIDKNDVDNLDEAFKVRNNIIHEMDIVQRKIAASRGNKVRQQRSAQNMEKYTKYILSLSQKLFELTYGNKNILISQENIERS